MALRETKHEHSVEAERSEAWGRIMKRKHISFSQGGKLLSEAKQVEIWTDGACWPNPGGPGAWAAILRYRSHEKTVSGFEKSTTNNRMEITAAIEGIRCLKVSCQIRIYSDSQYLVHSMQGRYRKWKNLDLWDQLSLLTDSHRVDWQWVRGHADNEMNCRADQLCELEMLSRGFVDGSGKYRKHK